MMESPQSKLDSSWSWFVLAVCTMGNTLSGSTHILFSLIYRDLVEEFQSSSAAVGWIGSIHCSCDLLSILFGMAIDKFGCRVVCMCGTIFSVLGFFLSFFAPNVTYLYFTYGFMGGVGIDIIVTTSYVNVMRHFDKQRPTAGVIISIGYSIGAILIGPAIRYLSEFYTWRGILVLYSCYIIQMLPASFFAFNLRNSDSLNVNSRRSAASAPAADKNDELEISNSTAATQPQQMFRQLFQDPAFVCYLMSCCFMYGGVIACLYHNPSRAQIIGIDKSMINFLPISMDATSMASKLVLAFVFSRLKFNRFILFTIALLGFSLIYMITPLFRTFPMLVLHGCVIGIFYALSVLLNSLGSIFSLHITLAVELKGPINVTRTQPLIYMGFGLSGLCTTPLAGFLFDITNNYDLTFIVLGFIIFIGSICSFLVAVMYAKQTRKRCLEEKNLKTKHDNASGDV